MSPLVSPPTVFQASSGLGHREEQELAGWLLRLRIPRLVLEFATNRRERQEKHTLALVGS